MPTNALHQPIGEELGDWQTPPFPSRILLKGEHGYLAPLTIEHAPALFEAFSLDTSESNWTYLPYGPFATYNEFKQWLQATALGDDPLFFTIFEAHTQKAVGMGSYLRIDPRNGVIEVGHLHFSPLLQRTPLATEAMFLMMQYVFSLGYRRYEWKCNALNEPSVQAALRLGFTYEGTFRQAAVVKGRNRDTAWFSILDKEWLDKKAEFERWLMPNNFDANGQQITKLSHKKSAD